MPHNVFHTHSDILQDASSVVGNAWLLVLQRVSLTCKQPDWRIPPSACPCSAAPMSSSIVSMASPSSLYLYCKKILYLCLLHVHTFTFHVVSITVLYESHPTIGILPEAPRIQNGSYSAICHWSITVSPTI